MTASRYTAYASVLGTKTVEFEANAASVAYSVSTFDNLGFQEVAGTSDPSQYVEVEVTASTGDTYDVGENSVASVLVTDNEEVVEFSLVVPDGGFRVAEGAGTLSFSISATTLTAGSPTDNNYRISVVSEERTADSAYSGFDFQPVSEVVSFGTTGWTTVTVDEETRYTKSSTLNVTIYDDRIAEGAESFHLDLRRSIGTVGNAPFGVKTSEVTILDDDTAGVTVSPTSMAVAEDSMETYTVVLTSEPEFEDVVVTVSLPSGTDLSTDSAELTFTPDNWETEQTVTVTAADDDDAVADAKVTIGHSAAGGGYGSVSVDSVEVTITENDTAGLEVLPTSLSVTENSTADYTVRLTSEPTAQVEVTISVPTNTDVSANKTALTFTARNWSTKQTVTVTAADDADAVADAAVTISHSVSGGDYGSLSVDSVTVTIKENDTAGVTVSPTTLSVTEGLSAAYTVELTSQPSGDVTLTVTVPTDKGVTANIPSLTFTSLNWSAKQTVTVTADDDDDAVVESAVTISHSASGGGYGSVSVDSVTVNITETDTAGVLLSARALTVAEGAMDSYTVRLTSEPTASVVITVTEPTGGAVTVDKASLTFSTANWRTAQRVTVTATEDDDATMGAAMSITHSAAGGGYDSVSAASVSVTVTEDETVGVSVSPTGLTIVEGATNTYLVRLMSRPTADVTVSISVPSGTDVSANKTSLMFTTATWNTPQNVTVTAAQDTDITTDAAVTIAHGAAGGDYDMVSVPSVEVDVVEDDRKASVSADQESVTEGGDADFTVSLAGGAALAPMTVSYSVSGTAASAVDYTAPSGTVWIDAQEDDATFTIETKSDDVLEAAETLVVTLTGVTPVQGTATVNTTPATTAITDPGMVTVSVGPATASEGDALKFPVTLSGMVSSDVVVACSTSSGSAESGADFTTMTDAALTIAAGGTAGFLTVSTAEDVLAEGDETFEMTISSTTLPAGVRFGVTTAVGTIEDDDELAVSVAATPPILYEGQAAMFTVSLGGGASTADVIVSYSVAGTASRGSDYVAPPGSLTIGPGLGSATISIATISDDGPEGDETLTVILDEATTAKGEADVDTAPAVATIRDRSAGAGGSAEQILLSASPSIVAEDGGARTVEVTATLDGERRVTPISVTVTVTGGTATRHQDFKRVAPFDVTIPAGTPSGRASFVLTPIADSTRESSETVLLSGVADTPDLLVTGAEVVIVDSARDPDTDTDTDPEPDPDSDPDPDPDTDSDPDPDPDTDSDPDSDPDPDPDPVVPREVVLTLEPRQVPEGSGPTAVTVTAGFSGGARREDTVVQIKVAGGGGSTAVDFASVDPFEITIPAGTASGSARFVLRPEDDRVDEQDERIQVSGVSSLPVVPATLLLEDDDEASKSIALVVAPEVIPEGGGPVVVDVIASFDVSARPVVTPVAIALSNSGEPGAVDYRAVESFELKIPPGAQRGTASFTLTPEDDRVDELHETIRVSGTAALPVTPASVVLEDDDEPSEAIHLSVAPRVILEDAGATLVTVMASLDRSARVRETGVSIEVEGSHRESVVRFEPVETFGMTIPPGELSGFGTFLLVPVNDMEEARTESVEVRGEADLPVSPATLSLLDDDDASLARAWLSRFARTVAIQTVEALEERIEGRSASLDHLTLAGRRILGERDARQPAGAGAGVPWFGGPPPGAPLPAGPLPVGATSAGGGWPTGRGPFGPAGRKVGPTLMGGSIVGGGSLGGGQNGPSSPGVFAGWSGRGFSLGRYRPDQRWDLLARSSFSLSSRVRDGEAGDGAGAGNWTAWGRGAMTYFRGAEGDLSLTGDVITGTVGVDIERGRFLSGLAVGFSRGEGGFRDGANAEASLTSGHPYLRVRVNEKLDVWGVLGYGRGEFSLTEESGDLKETGIEFTMGAIGLRRDLASSARGFGLSLLSDVLLARIESDPVPGLAAVSDEVNRIRLAVEGGYDHSLAGGGTLAPTVELGIRHDGGDADTGAGVEIGAGLRYVNPERGIRIEFGGRSLLTHQAAGFEEWGGSAALTLDPGESGRGPALGLRSSWGAAHGGVRQLWSRQQMFDPAGGRGFGQGGRLEVEAGYGLGRSGGRSLVSPYGVLVLGGQGERGFGAGARYDFARTFSLGLEVSRRRFAGMTPEHAIALRGVLRLGPRSNRASPARTTNPIRTGEKAVAVPAGTARGNSLLATTRR